MLNASKLATSWGKKKQSSFQMRGINLSDNYSEWEFARMKGFSMRRFPYLSVRKKREEVEGYANVSSIKAWENLVAVSGTDLIYDGQVVGQVSEGEKQFEIVNTKVVVMPDKVYFDISKENPTLKSLGSVSEGSAASFDGGTVSLELEEYPATLGGTFTNNSLTINTAEQIALSYSRGKAYSLATAGGNTTLNFGYCDYIFVKKLTVRGGEITISTDQSLSDLFQSYTNYIRIYGSSANGGVYQVKYESPFILKTIGDAIPEDAEEENVFIVLCDSEGKIINNIMLYEHFERGDRITLSEQGRVILSGIVDTTFAGGMLYITDVTGALSPSEGIGSYSLYKGNGFPCSVEETFEAGDALEFSGTSNDHQSVTVDRVEGDTIYFKQSSLTPSTPSSFTIKADRWADGDPYGSLDMTKRFSVGDFVTVEADHKVYENVEVKDVGVRSISFNGIEYESPVSVTYLKIERRIPDFDFICESDNRLYGCVNSEQTIYASALGDPTNFFVDPTLSTGSYAVAVSSAGEFTGCCKYGSSVLFFKETKLHKLLGSYPAEYTLYSYDMEGVRKGCGKSLCVVNDTLLYLSLSGVFAYTGGTPSLISPQFGEHIFGEGVGGNDGDTYYLSAKDLSTNEWYLFLYETKYGTWVNEGYEQVKDFARRGEDFYMLLSDGKVYKEYGATVDPLTEFEGITKPFREDRTSDGYSLKKKRYNKIIVRFTIGTGARVNLHYRFEGGMWQSAGYLNGAAEDIIQIPLNYNRADNLELKISGHGDVVILGIDMIYSERTVR